MDIIKKNEYILSQFFQAKDPAKRKEIDVFKDVETKQDPNMISMPNVNTIDYFLIL